MNIKRKLIKVACAFIPHKEIRNNLKIKLFKYFSRGNQRAVHSYLNKLRVDKTFDYKSLNQSKNIINCIYDAGQGVFPHIFKKATFNYKKRDKYTHKIIWGSGFDLGSDYKKQPQGNVYFAEDSYIRSIATFADDSAEEKLKQSISVVIDDLGLPFNCFYTNRLEQKINSNFSLTPEQYKRAQECINKIRKNHISKYNFQPILKPKIGRKNVKKVLVLDQSYGDESIYWSNSSKNLFHKMLESAIKENPEADIIVKVHPDALVEGSRSGYFNKNNTVDKFKNANIYLYADTINAISMIEYVDKVYVMSSGMGFEAILCEKEVITFGCPFYAGWGLTDDRNTYMKKENIKNRRNKLRSIKELFYLTYIWYPLYLNPEENKICEIEDAINWIIRERDKYFKSIKKG